MIVVRIVGFVGIATLIISLFGQGELAIFSKLAWYEEARAALRDPVRTNRVDAKLVDRRTAHSNHYVSYSFKTPENDIEYFETDAWGTRSDNQVSKQTFDSLGDQAKSIPIVYLRENPWIHEVASELEKPTGYNVDGMGWRILFALLVVIELPLFAAAWWICLGTQRGVEVIHGSLGCKIGTKFVNNGIESTYSLSPLSLPSADKKTIECTHTCPLCDKDVQIRVRTLTAARGESVLIVIGTAWFWLMAYGVFAVVNNSFRWVTFPWTTILFSIGAVVASAISFLWVINPGFNGMATVLESESYGSFSKSHATFNKTTSSCRL